MPVFKIGLYGLLDNDHKTVWFETKSLRKLGTFTEKNTVSTPYSGYQGGEQIDIAGRYRYEFSNGDIVLNGDDENFRDKEFLSTNDASEYLRLKEIKNAEKNAAAAAKANNEKRKEIEEFNKNKAGLKTAFNDILFTMEIMALKYVREDGASVNTKGKNTEELLSGIVDMLRLIDSALPDITGYAAMCARATAKKTAAAAAKVLTYFSKPNNALATSSNNNNSRNKYVKDPNTRTKKNMNVNIGKASVLINTIHTKIFEGSELKKQIFSIPKYTEIPKIAIESEKLSDITNNISTLVKNIATFKENIKGNFFRSCTYAAGSTTATAVGTAATAAATTAASAASRAKAAFGSLWGTHGGKTAKKNKKGQNYTRNGKKRV